MGGVSIWHWLVLAVVAMLFLGKGRFSDFMGDAAKGIKSFKKGLTEEEEAASRPQPPVRLQSNPSPEPNPDPSLQPMKEDTRPQG